MADFTNAQKRDCAKREADMRVRVYPNWVNSGKMTDANAKKQIALMREIEADYGRLAEADEQAGSLF